MSRILVYLACLSCALSVCAGGFFYLNSSSVNSEDPFPNQHKQTVLIPRHDGQVIAYYDYDRQGHVRIKRQGKIFYDEKNDNVVETTTYRSDGTMDRSDKVFPLLSEQGQTAYRRLALFDLDGVTFLRHEVYGKEGSLVRLGMRLPDKQYRIRYYYANGKTLLRDRHFTPYPGSKHRYVGLPVGSKIEDPRLLLQKYVLDNERTFRTDGSLQTEIYRLQESFYKRFFNTKGKRIAIFSREVGGTMNGEIYTDDARLLRVTFSRKDDSLQAYFRRENGSYSQVRKVHGNRMIDTYYGGTPNRPVYEQHWLKSKKKNGEPEYTLSHILEFGDDLSVSRTITFQNGEPYSVIYAQPNSTTLFKYVDEQGYVLRTETKRGREVISFTMPDEQTEQETIFQSWLVRSAPVDVDSVRFEDPSSPPWIYDYDDSKFKDLN